MKKEAWYHLAAIPMVVLAFVYLRISGKQVTAVETILAIAILPASFGFQTNYNLLLNRAKHLRVTYLTLCEALLLPALLPLALYGIVGYLTMYALKTAATSALSFWLVGSLKGQTLEGGSVVIRGLKHQHLSLAIKSVWSNLDVTAVGTFSGNQAVAEYRIIKSLVSMLPLLIQPVWNWSKSSVLEEAKRGRWDLVRARVRKIAYFIGIPILAVSPFGAFLLTPSIQLVYGFTPAPAFKTVFWFCFVATAAASGITAWSRFLAVLRDDLAISLKVNLFLSALLAVSPFGLSVFGIPIPVQLSLGLMIVTLIWWRWLFALR